MDRHYRPGRYARLSALIVFTGMSLLSGCARYAHSINDAYTPTATVRDGTGTVHIVIPENQKSPSAQSRWVLGKVSDDRNRQLDEVFSSQSPAEIIQTSLKEELQRAGYSVISATALPDNGQWVVNLSQSRIEVQQLSSMMTLKVNCQLLVRIDLLRNGEEVKWIQYEISSSGTDVKDRDTLAGKVLQEVLKSLMQKVVPELHALFRSS
jgi:hypothetical protein